MPQRAQHRHLQGARLAQSDVAEEDMVTVEFNPGPVGVTWEDKSTGSISRVAAGGQADMKGVLAGWLVQQIDGQPYSYDTFCEKKEGTMPYIIAFSKDHQDEVGVGTGEETLHNSQKRADARRMLNDYNQILPVAAQG